MNWAKSERLLKPIGITFLVIVGVLMGFLIHTQYGVEQYYAAKEEKKNSESTCVEKWARSGLASSYNKKGGCLVEIRTDVWVPEVAVKFHK